jgi:hypothetical protein
MKKINKLLIILMILITLGVAIFNFRVDRIFTNILIIPTLLVPLLCKKLKIKLSDIDICIYYIFLFLAQVLGCICNLYNIIWWYDLFAHFLSGIFTFYIAIVLLKNMNMYKEDNIIFNIIFCLCFTAFVALTWEVVEYSADNLFKLNLQHNIDTGVVDTMEDMIIAMTASIICSIIKYIKHKKK